MHKNQEFVQKCWYVNVCVRSRVSSSGLLLNVSLLLITVLADLLLLSSFNHNKHRPPTDTHTHTQCNQPAWLLLLHFSTTLSQPSTSHLLSLSSLCPYSQPTSSSLPTHKNDNKPLWKYLILLDLMDQSLIIRWVRVSFTNDCVHKSFCTSWLRVAHVNVV